MLGPPPRTRTDDGREHKVPYAAIRAVGGKPDSDAGEGEGLEDADEAARPTGRSAPGLRRPG